MQRIKLFKSHKILLQMKNGKVQEAINLAQARQNEVQVTLNLIITELGILKEELDQWKLTEDGQAIEKIEPEKPKKNKEKEE